MCTIHTLLRELIIGTKVTESCSFPYPMNFKRLEDEEQDGYCIKREEFNSSHPLYGIFLGTTTNNIILPSKKKFCPTSFCSTMLDIGLCKMDNDTQYSSQEDRYQFGQMFEHDAHIIGLSGGWFTWLQ